MQQELLKGRSQEKFKYTAEQSNLMNAIISAITVEIEKLKLNLESEKPSEVVNLATVNRLSAGLKMFQNNLGPLIYEILDNNSEITSAEIKTALYERVRGTGLFFMKDVFQFLEQNSVQLYEDLISKVYFNYKSQTPNQK